MSAEAERVRQGGAYLLLDIAVYAVIEVAFLVGHLISDSCVDKALFDGLCADDSFDAASRAEKVTCHRLGRIYLYLVCVLAECELDSGSLVLVVETCRVP